MISIFGNFFLWLSLAFALFQFINSYKKNSKNVIYLNNIASSGLLFCSVISFLILIYAHVVSDFSLINVYQNSHTTKPLLYKISGVWGNHEGSMLLWILVISIFNIFIFKLYNQKNYIFISKILETQAMIAFGFISFTIFTSNPFSVMLYNQSNGLGFNPILQDPALIIHPPFLYIGYVGFSAAFSISVAALSLNTNEKTLWYNYMKPFVVAAWTFLSIGIALGSVWAYYELGWGGWWFWDPVENASFMPWLLGTALMHSLIIVEKRKSFQTWVLLLAILTFLLSIIGTFLVRSGILTSVHTFALDPTKGIYIIILASLLGSYSLILYALNSKKYLSTNYFSFFSKEGAILVNNILMVVVCATVLLGTIYPLLVEVFTNNKISVGEPYFNSTVVPIIIPALVVMGFGPILSWGKDNKFEILKKSSVSILFTFLATILIFSIYPSSNFIGILGIVLALWLIINNLNAGLKKIFIKNNFRIFISKSTKIHSSGMIVAHLGVGLLLLGITSSSVWQSEKITRVKIGDEIMFKSYKLVFENIKEIKGKNYLAIQGNFLVYKETKKIVTKLSPENRYYPITNNFTTEASIHTNLSRDLYIVLGERDNSKGWIVRLYHNPLVVWIWIGAIFIFFGGLLTIAENLKKIRKT